MMHVAVDEQPRDTFIKRMDSVLQLDPKDKDTCKCGSWMEAALQDLNQKKGDPQGCSTAGASFAAHAQKDMSWKQALNGPHRERSIEALDKELDSL